jgi:phage terminase small subunit
MGSRGPRLKLPQIAQLEGNPGKRPITAPVVEATGDVFVPPHLEPAAKACIEVILASMPPGTYAGSDTFLLAAFATAWSLHRQAVMEIGKPDFEHVVKSARGGRQLNPWLRVLSQQAMVLASLGDRLGLNPKARASLHMPDDRPPSKFAGLVGPETTSKFDA